MLAIIETERLILTPVCQSDAEQLQQLWAQPLVRQYLCDGLILPLSQIQEMIAHSIAAFSENRYGLWMAKLKNQAAIIGFSGYWPFFEPPEVQLIYGLAPEHWGQGLATEMARALLTYGFETYQMSVIRASANLPNAASVAVMKRLGMTFEKQIIVEEQELVFYKISL